MRRLRPSSAVLAIFITLAATTAWAANQKWVGTAATDFVFFGKIIAKLRPVTATTAVGTARCVAVRPNRCLAQRYVATLTLTGPTSFEAVLRASNGIACAATGSVAGTFLDGEYGCIDRLGQVIDTGVFRLTRRR